MAFIAHRNADDGMEQSMADHLTQTACLAAQFAKWFGAQEPAYRMGLLHDIGKYSEKFQRRIRGANVRVNHSTAGALVCRANNDIPAAFCIAGHHGGLPNGGSPKFDTAADSSFWGKMKCTPGSEIEDFSAYLSDIIIPPAETPRHFITDPLSGFFYIHMLYSCLIDADRLDTEAFFTGAPHERIGEPLDALLGKLNAHIAPWQTPQNALNEKRSQILRAMLDGGGRKPGLFSLTVPTGGGKTISSMAFALRHAVANSMRRVIYVIPYSSIIEQTERVFEKIFGTENVLAHYANVDFRDDEDDKRRLAAENWDAPIVLTTAVQFFESLYASNASRCRKLHNITNSTIIFDEAQTLPVPYLKPCIGAIAQLVTHYGCSAVLCTATQPALRPLLAQFLPDTPVHELCPHAGDMYAFFRRVRYENAGKLADDVLAAQLSAQPQALCIVNSKKQARALFTMLPPGGSFHLTTNMTPLHRRKTLDEIRDRLRTGKPCRVIATSLIEAGVDVDFPVVWRALAGLDSIVQAGGRCNRENKRALDNSIVYLFETEAAAPQILHQNIAATRYMLKNYTDIASPEAIEAYFQFLFYTLKDESALDKKQILAQINGGTFPFADISAAFRLIENDERTVYVPWENGEALIADLRQNGPNRALLRKLGPYAVGVHREYYDTLLRTGAIEPVADNAAVLRDQTMYDEKTGLSMSPNEGQALFF